MGLLTPVMIAVIDGQAQMVQFLLEHGADSNLTPNRLRRTALMYASMDNISQKAGGTEVMSLLLKAGADPNAESTIGETALFYALMTGKSLMPDEHNPDLYHIQEDQGSISKRRARVELLLNHGARKDIGIKTKVRTSRGTILENPTPLMLTQSCPPLGCVGDAAWCRNV